MKKPVRKTDAQIRELMEKRATKNIEVTEQLRPGDLKAVKKQFKKFAEKVGVDVDDVRVGSVYYSGARFLKARRPETEAEKFRRLKDAEYYRHQQERVRYDQWLYQERARKEREALQAVTVNVSSRRCSCPPSCCCRS